MVVPKPDDPELVSVIRSALTDFDAISRSHAVQLVRARHGTSPQNAAAWVESLTETSQLVMVTVEADGSFTRNRETCYLTVPGQRGIGRLAPTAPSWQQAPRLDCQWLMLPGTHEAWATQRHASKQHTRAALIDQERRLYAAACDAVPGLSDALTRLQAGFSNGASHVDVGANTPGELLVVAAFSPEDVAWLTRLLQAGLSAVRLPLF